MRPRSIDLNDEKRASVPSVVVRTMLQMKMVAALIWLRTMGPPDWLSGLLLFLAIADLITIPFTFAALRQRLREIERGELDEARKY